ncbi:hypothetical protein GJAV_G00163530 [Gymnothorax javanicus]|nr:hypothetical protein GJAV_G00163530 [Gymnothorax javanicus]
MSLCNIWPKMDGIMDYFTSREDELDIDSDDFSAEQEQEESDEGKLTTQHSELLSPCLVQQHSVSEQT